MKLAEFQRAESRKWRSLLPILLVLLIAMGLMNLWPHSSDWHHQNLGLKLSFFLYAAFVFEGLWYEGRRWQRLRRLNEMPTAEERELWDARSRLNYSIASAIFIPCFICSISYGTHVTPLHWVFRSLILATGGFVLWLSWKKFRKVQRAVA